MSEKKIEPTEAMVDDLADYLGRLGLLAGHPGVTRWPPRVDTMDTRRIVSAVLSHPDAPGLFVDEDTIRAAREQGWDQATRWIDSYQGGPNGRTTSARSANPYRPAPVLPTKPGAVIVPADGHEHITATVGGVTYRAREAIFSCSVLWLGVWRSIDSTAVSALPEDITPGTWKVEGE